MRSSTSATKETCRGRVCLQVIHIIELQSRVVPADMRISRQLHLTWCGGDGLRGHLKRRLWLILAHRVLLTRRYLTPTCCSQTAQSESFLGLRFSSSVPSCAASGSETAASIELTANLQKHFQQGTAETPSPRTTSPLPCPRTDVCGPPWASAACPAPQPCKPSPAPTACHLRPDGPLRPHGEITLLQAIHSMLRPLALPLLSSRISSRTPSKTGALC